MKKLLILGLIVLLVTGCTTIPKEEPVQTKTYELPLVNNSEADLHVVIIREVLSTRVDNETINSCFLCEGEYVLCATQMDGFIVGPTECNPIVIRKESYEGGYKPQYIFEKVE